MKQFGKPFWIFITTTLPVAILVFIQWRVYQTVVTELDTESLRAWRIFGNLLVGFTLLYSCMAGYFWWSKKAVPLWVSVSFFFSYLFLILAYLTEGHELMLPRAIPNWVLPGDRFIYPGTFLMPALIHQVVLMMLGLTPNPKENSIWKNGLVVVGIPFGFYLIYIVIVPLFSGSRAGEFGFVSIFTLIVLSAFSILFFMARSLYIRSVKNPGKSRWAEPWLRGVMGIGFPVLALWLHHDAFDDPLGNFSSFWFYGLAVLNGATLLIPAGGSRYRKLFRLGANALMFPFIGYFFLVFAPYLPLSFLFILAFGVGLLMLLPLLLGLWQVQNVSDAWTEVARSWNPATAVVTVLLGLTVLPLSVTLVYQQHRHSLFEALDYVYAAPLDDRPIEPVNTRHLQRTLEVLEAEDAAGTDSFWQRSDTPLLNWYYRWLVLDNLTLSRAKREKLYEVFLNQSGPEGWRTWRGQSVASTATLVSVDVRSTYDQGSQMWRSWIDLTIAGDSSRLQSEYRTLFRMPQGVYVSNYYLDMPDGQRKYGLLAEKKAALWVYRQIQRMRRDPGLIYYQDGQRMALRVFPVMSSGIRTTGFEVLHKEPITLQLDGEELALGDGAVAGNPERALTAVDGATTYVPAAVKASLPLVQRRPYFHFLIPGGEGHQDQANAMLQKVDQYLATQPEAWRVGARVSLCGAYTTTVYRNELSSSVMEAHPWVGGLYWERALERIAYQSITETSDTYPIPVVWSSDEGYFDIDAVALWPYLPERPKLRVVQSENELAVDPAVGGYAKDEGTWTAPQVRAWPDTGKPTHYLANDGEPSVIVQPGETYPSTIPKGTTASPFEAGLLIEAQQQHRALYPQQAQARWLDVVRTSFRHQILSPATAYMVVENAAQEAALKRKQNQILNSEHFMDADTEELEPMPEPELWLLVILFGAWYWWRYRRGRSGQQSVVS